MATSSYFNNYNSKYNEQRLVEDLIVESIKIMGFDAHYLPINNEQDRDLLYGEDPVKHFKTSFSVEMYLSSDPMDYIGQKDIFTKFGLEIKDDVNVIVSRRAFEERVLQNPDNHFSRPREGDLVYIPFLNGTGELYEIKFAEQSKDFHMLGRTNPYFYELSLEKFKYSQEVIATGIPDIDSVVTNNAYTLHLNTGTGTGKYLQKEIVSQTVNGTVVASATVQGWLPQSNILSVTTIFGEFQDGQTIVGETSGAQYTLTTFDPLVDHTYSESYDNKHISDSANSIIDFSETNPFGSI
jgi:hypothetical protein